MLSQTLMLKLLLKSNWILDNFGLVWFIMSPLLKGGGGTYCFWDGSRWRWRRGKTSCPLCNLNTLWNILMILGRNVDQDEMMCHIQDWQLWLSYFWSYHPLFYWKRFCVRSVTWIPLEYFSRTWQKCRTGPDDMSRTRMTTLPFLHLALSPFVIFDSDNPLILCPLCKSNTFGIFLWYLVEM